MEYQSKSLINHKFLYAVILGLSLVSMLLASRVSLAQDIALNELNTLYQALLTDYVSPGEKNGLSANMVNYGDIRNDDRLNALMTRLQNYPLEKLNTAQKKTAFYLNAYNILSITKVADNWPLKKLKSLGSFFKPVWTHPAGKVCGEKMTLRILERDILMQLNEPRVHFALNCASMSCPNLRLEPYKADILDFQLEDQVKVFMSQEGKGMLMVGDGKVKLSKIFEWFGDDFEPLGGVSDFIQAYLPSSDKPWEITGYLNYDWDVTCILSGSEKRKIKRNRNATIFRH
ncbi:MAG: hypothetical protein ACI9T9_000332 [Oleiphilaceae bacterium]|jgi:hypothetical protein